MTATTADAAALIVDCCCARTEDITAVGTAKHRSAD